MQFPDALGFLVAGPLTGLPSKLDAAVPCRCQARFHTLADEVSLELAKPAMIVRISLPLDVPRSKLTPV